MRMTSSVIPHLPCLASPSIDKERPIATMTVLKFPSAEGARAMLDTVQDLQKEQLATVQDAAIVQWPEGKSKPRTEQLHSMADAAALSGAFWDMLFGLLFFVPLLGAAIGAAMVVCRAAWLMWTSMMTSSSGSVSR